MAGFPDFRSNKSKSGSFITIAYIWPMKIRVAYKSGVVTAMNRRGKGKGSFEKIPTWRKSEMQQPRTFLKRFLPNEILLLVLKRKFVRITVCSSQIQGPFVIAKLATITWPPTVDNYNLLLIL